MRPRSGHQGRPRGRRAGRRAVAADVAVDGGTITAVGTVPGRDGRRSTPSGLLVTPGFVDIHTHYDGQATWDARMTPVELARRDDRRHGQLRRRASRRCGPTRTTASSRSWRASRTSRAPCSTRASTGRGRASASTSTPSNGGRTTSTCARSSPTARSASTSWASGPPAWRMRREEDAAAMRAPGDRGHARRCHRLLDVAHAEPPHGDRRPHAVAAGPGRRARGHRARRGRRRTRRDRAHLGLLPRRRRRVRAGAAPGRASGLPAVALAGPEPPAGPSAWRDLLAPDRGGGRRRTAHPGPGGARGPSACCWGCSRRTTRSRAVPAFGEIAGLPLEPNRSRALRDPAFRARLLAERRAPGAAAGRRLVDFARLFPLGDVPDYEPPPERSIAAPGRGPRRRAGRRWPSTC